MDEEDFKKKKACLIIRNYLEENNLPYNFTDDEIYEKYELAVEQLIRNSVKAEKQKGIGIKSMTQGQRSVTYSDNFEAWTVTEDIKQLLPKPKNFYAW